MASEATTICQKANNIPVFNMELVSDPDIHEPSHFKWLIDQAAALFDHRQESGMIKDRSFLAQMIHSLKAICLNLGFERLCYLCELTEGALDEHEEGQQIDHYIDLLNQNFSQSVVLLKQQIELTKAL